MAMNPNKVVQLRDLLPYILELPEKAHKRLSFRYEVGGGWINDFVNVFFINDKLTVSVTADVEFKTGYFTISENTVEYYTSNKGGAKPEITYKLVSTEEEHFQESLIHDLTLLDLDFFLNCAKLYALCDDLISIDYY